MKTKDFIKMLQEADPSGEAHIRMQGGVPTSAELKPGYWDGSYFYIDDGNYIRSSDGMKVDINTTNIEDFIESNYDLHTPGMNTWDDIKMKFKVKLSNTFVHNKEEEHLLKTAKESYDEIERCERECLLRSTAKMIENSEKGWKWFQNKDVDKNLVPNLHKYYTWKIYDNTGKEMGSNLHHTESVLYSGLWEKIDNEMMPGYYQWIKKSSIK